MTATLLIEQVLNGLQFGTMLFLMAAGLTLVFGVMGLINLAHGSLYMVGAFAAATAAAATGTFLARASSPPSPPPPPPARSSRSRCSAASTAATTSTRCSRPSP